MFLLIKYTIAVLMMNTYASNILEVSNGIVTHDLIKNEEDKIGECKNEKK